MNIVYHISHSKSDVSTADTEESVSDRTSSRVDYTLDSCGESSALLNYRGKSSALSNSCGPVESANISEKDVQADNNDDSVDEIDPCDQCSELARELALAAIADATEDLETETYRSSKLYHTMHEIDRWLPKC